MQRNLKQFTSYFVEIVMFVCYVYFNEIAWFVLLIMCFSNVLTAKDLVVGNTVANTRLAIRSSEVG